ncbi:unnamed protein product [Ectocarpus sp. 13 AM-2016]
MSPREIRPLTDWWMFLEPLVLGMTGRRRLLSLWTVQVRTPMTLRRRPTSRMGRFILHRGNFRVAREKGQRKRQPEMVSPRRSSPRTQGRVSGVCACSSSSQGPCWCCMPRDVCPLVVCGGLPTSSPSHASSTTHRI